MCLAIPGRVIRWIERDPLAGTAEIEFGAVRRVCHMACVPTAAAGDFVIVHAGVAISIMDTAEADRVLQELTAVATATTCGEPHGGPAGDAAAGDSSLAAAEKPAGPNRAGEVTG